MTNIVLNEYNYMYHHMIIALIINKNHITNTLM